MCSYVVIMFNNVYMLYYVCPRVAYVFIMVLGFVICLFCFVIGLCIFACFFFNVLPCVFYCVAVALLCIVFIWPYCFLCLSYFLFYL